MTFLLHHYLQQTAGRNHRTIEGFSEEAFACLKRYDYPGNIRELRNVIEYGVCICRGSLIELSHLPRYLLDRDSVVEAAKDKPTALPVAGEPPQAAGKHPPQDRKSWDDHEKDLIISAMLQARGNRSQAADLLGWGRTTLWRKLKQHGLTDGQDEPHRQEGRR